MDNPIPQLRIVRHRLANGLQAFIYEDHALPIVAVNINYKVGSKNERPGRTGFAHLFEHLMFEGSRHSNEHFFRPLQEIGALVNGGTTADRTRYWEVVPLAHLERALWLESDRMGFLLDAITQERFDNQRSVVKNERRQNYENRPYGTVREQIAAVLYPPNHPYNWIPIGSMADLDAATLEDVQAFFRTYYTPNNAAVCLAGDIDAPRAIERLEAWFGSLPPGPTLTRIAAWVPALAGDVELEIEDRVELPRSQQVWHTVPAFHADDAALDVLGRILGGGKASRLYRALVYDRQLAQEASASEGAQELAGTFTITLVPRPGHALLEVEQAAHDVLGELLANGIHDDELQRTLVAITAESVHGMQNLGGFGGLSDKINEYDHYLGEPDRFRWDLERYLSLTPARVNEVARKYLRAPRLVARVRPRPNFVAAAPAVDRTTMPARGASTAFRLPQRQRFTLGNGLEVVLVGHHKLPTVQMTLIARAGAAADPADRHGLASLTAGLLQEGAGGRSAQDIAESLERLGAELQANVAMDLTAVGLFVMKPFLADALAIYADVIARPDFPAAELERQRQRRLVQFRQLSDTPEYLAGVASTRALFPGHPYGHLSLGSPEGVAALTLDDVRGHWSGRLVPTNATLLVVGDVEPAELRDRLESAFAGWNSDAARPVDVPEPRPHGPRTIYLVDKPGAAQSMIVASQLGVSRTSPDHAALELLNAAFGGQFVSRLNLTLREEKGYTYGARSGFDYRRVAGTFGVRVPVETAVTAPALADLVAEFEALVGPRPLTEDELRFAAGAIVGGYAQRFETPGQIARELVEVVAYGLPDDTPERYPDALESVTAAALARLAPAVITPDRLALVVVGDAARIHDDLVALGLGEMVTVTISAQ